jgi:hypothetical protein
MEVIAVAEDRFWLHEGGPMPSGAEEYDGPPPTPLDQVRRDLPVGSTAERAWCYSRGDDGGITVMPTTIVRSPDGDVLHSFRGRRGGSLAPKARREEPTSCVRLWR